MSKVTDDMLAEALNNCLHGSGWDTKWEVVETTRKNFLCKIDYHAMDENGYYDGYFTIKVHLKKNLEDFKIHFSASSYHRRKYLWDKDYFWDTFQLSLEDIKKYVDKLLKDDLALKPA